MAEVTTFLGNKDSETPAEAIVRAPRIWVLLDPRYGEPPLVPMLEVSKDEALRLINGAPEGRPVSLSWDVIGLTLRPFGLK